MEVKFFSVFLYKFIPVLCNLQLSLVIICISNPQKFSEIFRNVCVSFRQFLNNLRKEVGNLRQIVNVIINMFKYNKQINTWLLVDMEYLFLLSTLCLIHLLCSLVRYQLKMNTQKDVPYLPLPKYCTFIFYALCRCQYWTTPQNDTFYLGHNRLLIFHISLSVHCMTVLLRLHCS